MPHTIGNEPQTSIFLGKRSLVALGSFAQNDLKNQKVTKRKAWKRAT